MSRTKTWLPILVVLVELAALTPARPAAYVVDRIKLGDRIPLNTPDYRSYSCQAASHFENYTWCERTRPRSASAGGGSISNTIMHAEDGTAIYLMEKIAPVAIDRSAAQKEIDELSRQINERPIKVEWVPASAGAPASVIATWGRVELRKLRREDAEVIGDGDDHSLGVLVDSGGDVVRSAKAGLPIFRVAGGAGYVYTASLDARGRGHRRHIAIDVSAPAIAKFEPQLKEVLQADQALAADDYSLWPKVAEATRNLSLETSPMIANDALDKVFEQFPSKKLRSHAWSLLPLGSLYNLPDRAYWSVSVYGPNTKYPEIRESILTFLAQHPSEPFSEFLYFTIGDFDKALKANPKSIISGVLRYGSGHKILEALLLDVRKVVKLPKQPDQYFDEPVNDTLVALNAHPELYDGKLLGSIVPGFAARAAAIHPWFEAVIADETSPHRDDAAYMLAWLAYHEGKSKDALGYLSKAMSLGNGDYRKPAAMRLAVRIMARVSAREQIAMIEQDPVFGQQPALWYLAARSAYRDFDYALAIATAERGLKELKVPVDGLPATTDPEKIKDALDKVEPKLDDDLNIYEMPYLLEASREIQQYETYLKTATTAPVDTLAKRVREIIVKYSMLLDRPEQDARRRGAPGLAHKDLRQAAHLADVSLANVPKDARHAALREWLHYRKVRILVQFAPKTVPDAVAAMEQEYPNSQLMDDALAEQIYAEGVMQRNLSAAQNTFRKLLAKYPKGNAVDNAYTWMAIIYRCLGRPDDAQKTNREIMRLFPSTRHASYARERLANPSASACGLWDTSQQ